MFINIIYILKKKKNMNYLKFKDKSTIITKTKERKKQRFIREKK